MPVPSRQAILNRSPWEHDDGDELMNWRGILISFLIAGCARQQPYRGHVASMVSMHANTGKEIAAPTKLEPKHWYLGQWALYKRRYGNDIGYERISLVAIDSCGYWFEYRILENIGRWQWTFCVAPKPGMPRETHAGELRFVISQMMRQEASVFDLSEGTPARKHQFDWLLSRVAFASWQGRDDLLREDIEVPAGRIAQTVKVVTSAERMTSWSHPDVPFDGMVQKRKDDGREELVLLAYGDDGVPSVIPDLASSSQPKRTGRIFFDVGYGFGAFTGTPGRSSSFTGGINASVGVRATHRLDVAANAFVIDHESSEPDPSVSQTALVALVTARWSPFWLRRPGPSAGFYVKPGLGYAALERSTATESNTVAHGFAVGAGVGYLLRDPTRDWSAGFELSDHAVFFNSGEGWRNTFSVTAFYELYLWWL